MEPVLSRRRRWEYPDSCGRLAVSLRQLDYRGSPRQQTRLLPQPKPRAMPEHFVVPPIRSRDGACIQRSGVGCCPSVRRCAQDARISAMLCSASIPSNRPVQSRNESNGSRIGLSSAFVGCLTVKAGDRRSKFGIRCAPTKPRLERMVRDSCGKVYHRRRSSIRFHDARSAA